MTSRVDWIQPTEGAKIISLWECLHDGDLYSVTSDLLTRTVRLVVAVEYIRNFHNLPEGLTFVVQLEGVNSVRVTRWAKWPGEFSVPEGTSRLDERRLVDEYWAKWREESESWNSFEATIPNGDIEIRDASLAVGNSNGVALKMGIMRQSSYHELFLSAESLQLARSDGDALDLSQFLELGKSYWNAFGNRHLESRESGSLDG